MPQEVIHPSTPPGGAESPPIRLRAVVGWTRELDAQIGLQVENTDHTLVDMLFGDPTHLQGIGRRMLTEPDGTEPDMATPAGRDLCEAEGQRVLRALREERDYVERDGVWMTLTRRQINALIQSLRKARDAAYGKDQ